VMIIISGTGLFAQNAVDFQYAAVNGGKTRRRH
jgi:hypothetical protein